MNAQSPSELLLFVADDGSTHVDVRLEDDTVWLTQQQIAELFDTSKQNIQQHIANVFEEGELSDAATVKNFLTVRQEGSRIVERDLIYYNLDVIISVGYRVKSRIATKFRMWATDRLRDYLVKGVAVNEARLAELGQLVSVLSRANNELVAGVAEVLSAYLPSLTLLRDYDEGELATSGGSMPGWTLSYEEARAVIDSVAAEFPHDTLFGAERGDALRGIVDAIYQGFAGEQIYRTVEQKAANLLYLVVKDHPLADGNKRSAAALFVTFLARNGQLHNRAGEPRISNNALAAIALMVAMSDPREKELLIALIVRMLTTEEPT
ncbi:MAG TPA: virulence protein RhuM/Fic/DOC family protein [Microbacteriaceae bacterium]|nr:virulence protein RhuM/Fic/DOC family protein [Microbacteriaceae bacterium]